VKQSHIPSGQIAEKQSVGVYFWQFGIDDFAHWVSTNS